jgi:hypothetical protein
MLAASVGQPSSGELGTAEVEGRSHEEPARHMLTSEIRQPGAGKGFALGDPSLERASAASTQERMIRRLGEEP